ncbi:alpha/beta hydrolase [Galbibacter sp. BG1]|uniref:alpha/beta hydrolase n=1 Tax=Galbibacter sp. BG1 TaxID=1170699 RepID=UPI0015B9F5E0|nr:alpha/beta hydrolase-fold protein [Galbibacter sp. BG1]QLE00346.1 alpha/beta hydrolase [Galbibacter sp. BG1]
MRKILITILLLSSIISFGQNDRLDKGRVTLDYEIKYITSEHYPNEERILRIFLPKYYDSSIKYPVVYTLDGQTLFDAVIKNVSVLQDKTFDDNNIIPECITVAIDNNNRSRDLTPNLGFNSNLELGDFKEGPKTFYNILNQEIVPFIDSNYSTSGYNVIIGHSDSGHFVTQLYLKNDNPFDGIIALSINDGGNYFRRHIPEKLKQEESKLLFIGYGNMDVEFNGLGYFLDSLKLDNNNLMIKKYNANHIQMPFVSLCDALRYVFSDYRFYDKLIDETFNKEFDYQNFTKKYKKNILKKYGVKTEIGYDVDYLLNKALVTDNTTVFHNILDDIDRTKILQLQFRFWYCNEFNQNERAKKYLYQMLNSDDETDKLIFFANLDDQYLNFFVKKLKQPLEFIDFVEQAKVKWSEYTLEFNYLILKTLVNEKIKSFKKREYYKYCEQNFKENRYFDIKYLKKLNKK